MAKKPKKIRRRRWTMEEYAALRQHSKARTPAIKVAKQLRRTPGALRVQAHFLQIPLGHQAAARS
jgi:hypothetical protein